MSDRPEDTDVRVRAVRDLEPLEATLEDTTDTIINHLGEVARRHDVMIAITISPYNSDAPPVEDVGRRD